MTRTLRGKAGPSGWTDPKARSRAHLCTVPAAPLAKRCSARAERECGNHLALLFAARRGAGRIFARRLPRSLRNAARRQSSRFGQTLMLLIIKKRQRRKQPENQTIGILSKFTHGFPRPRRAFQQKRPAVQPPALFRAHVCEFGAPRGMDVSCDQGAPLRGQTKCRKIKKSPCGD